jgi:hypothetical protein
LFGLGVTDYLLDGFNAFDGIVTIVALIDVISSGGRSSLSAVQALRMVRIFKVFEGWKSMRNLLLTILKTLQDLFFYSLVLFLFLFVLAIAGRQLLGKHMGTGDARPRDHYDNIGQALLNCFQASTPENWNANLEDAKLWKGWSGAIYVVVDYMVLNWVVNSLFVAILLSNFGDEDKDDTTSAAGEAGQLPGVNAPPPSGCMALWYRMTTFCGCKRPDQDQQRSASGSVASSNGGTPAAAASSASLASPESKVPLVLLSPAGLAPSGSIALMSPPSSPPQGSGMTSPSLTGGRTIRSPGGTTIKNRDLLAHYGLERNVNLIPHYRSDPQASVFSRASRPSLKSKSRSSLVPAGGFGKYEEMDDDKNDELEGVSLYCFSPTNKFRMALAKFTFSTYFENFVLVVILVSCVLLALETPSLPHDSTIYKVVLLICRDDD